MVNKEASTRLIQSKAIVSAWPRSMRICEIVIGQAVGGHKLGY